MALMHRLGCQHSAFSHWHIPKQSMRSQCAVFLPEWQRRQMLLKHSLLFSSMCSAHRTGGKWCSFWGSNSLSCIWELEECRDKSARWSCLACWLVDLKREMNLAQVKEHSQNQELDCNCAVLSAQVWQRFALNSKKPVKGFQTLPSYRWELAQDKDQKAFWVQGYCLGNKAV